LLQNQWRRPWWPPPFVDWGADRIADFEAKETAEHAFWESW
jgi:hypothetical protein